MTKINLDVVYRIGRQNEFCFCKKHKTITEEDLEKARELSKTMGISELKNALFPTFPYSVVKNVLEENGIVCIKKHFGPEIGTHPSRKSLDEEHLKQHAHEYSLSEYYRIFNPPCARNTLRNRAIELGVSFKNIGRSGDRKAWSEHDLKVLKERFPVMGTRVNKLLEVKRSKDSIRTKASRLGISEIW